MNGFDRQLRLVAEDAYKSELARCAALREPASKRSLSIAVFDALKEEINRLESTGVLPEDFLWLQYAQGETEAVDRRIRRQREESLEKYFDGQLGFEDFMLQAVFALGEGERIFYKDARADDLLLIDSQYYQNVQTQNESYAKFRSLNEPIHRVIQKAGVSVGEAFARGLLPHN